MLRGLQIPTCSSDTKSGDKPPCIQNIVPSTKAAEIQQRKHQN